MITIDRKIHFFQISAKPTNGLNLSSAELLQHAFEHINDLEFNSGESGRYLKIDGTKSQSIVVNSNNGSIKAKIGTRRTGGLPSIENKGEEKPLDLKEDDSLFEPSHFIIFENGILGMEYNFFGPRAGSVRKYLIELVQNISHVYLKELYKDDASGVIASLSEIYKMEITAYADGIDRFGQLDKSLQDCFRACKKTSEGMEKISIELWSDARNELGMNISFKDKLANWLRVKENRDVVQNFKVQGVEFDTENASYFDLLEDKFVSKKTLLKQDSSHKTVKSSSAYASIQEAYDELKDDLVKAVI